MLKHSPKNKNILTFYLKWFLIIHKKISKFEIFQSYEDHVGPLTAISSFKQSEDVEKRISCNGSLNNLSQLFLTSSFDATVKLWNIMVIVCI